MTKKKIRDPITVGYRSIKPGERAYVELDMPGLFSQSGTIMPVHVIHGKRDGPVLFLSAALHGDEINGVEIIRRVLKHRSLNRLKGTLIAVPVVNVYGFLYKSRYLPDRRDLNRSFPGSQQGSMASRTANLFLTEIVSKCTHGIDLHTGAIHRDNLPQVRALMDDPETERMAHAFRAPVILNTEIVDGSLRAEVEKMGIPVIVYEAGEALRFDEVSIRAGTRGVIAIMRELGLLPRTRSKKQFKSMLGKSSSWVRAPKSGVLRSMKMLGATVNKGDLLGIVFDPFGEAEENVLCPADGIIIGRTNIPLVNEGEALFHIARFKNADALADTLEDFQYEMDPTTDDKPPPEPPIV
ncbi:MAG: succinylglutamate desuccinylase/aspartoacylase family protein [Gammaproteobacteria bacterium]